MDSAVGEVAGIVEIHQSWRGLKASGYDENIPVAVYRISRYSNEGHPRYFVAFAIKGHIAGGERQ